MQSSLIQSIKPKNRNTQNSVSQRRSKTLLQDNRKNIQPAVSSSASPLQLKADSKLDNSISLPNSTSASKQIIQCIPFWKKAATATAAAGSSALLVGGLMSSAVLAPAAAIAGGIGLAGSLAYAGYKGYHEYQRGKTHDDVQTELAQYGPGHANMGHLNKVAGRSLMRVIAPPGLGGLPGPAGPLAARNYLVEINTNNPTGEGATDADMIASATTHERTHIANDQSYNANVGRQTSTAPINLTNADLAASAIAAPGNHEDAIYDNVTALKRTVRTDKQIPNQWRQYIYNRLDYITGGSNPSLEYDTVVNELLHFMHAKGIEADSKTAQEITRMAKENHARR